ncbi:MAG: hypothetical protein K8R64_09145 [Methanosarcinaceae archaeon]|nr:hypothetical protein [Methanosarcinaceae archaeon]
MRYTARIIGVIALLFIFVFATVSPAVAGWEQTTTEITSTYEVIPEDAVIHVSKDIAFTNLDRDTRYWQGYYSNINHNIPDNAKNLHVYDSSGVLEFHISDGDHYTFEFSEKVWYEDVYMFNVEYDLDVNNNTATFYVNEPENTDISIIIPQEYETYIGTDGYTTEELSGNSIFILESRSDQRTTFLVDAVRHTEMNTMSDIVQLEKRDVKVTIEFWDGEEEWAHEMLDVAIESLPVLEDVWGFPYPVNYNITITQTSLSDTRGYGGSNNWSNGISMLHTSKYPILIHELAHYWTQACNFDQLWMDEGYADLYTYIVLNQTHPQDGEDRRDKFFELYESLKPTQDIVLSEWSTPDEFTELNSDQIHYGYKKSFALTYMIYDEIGLDNMRTANTQFRGYVDIDSAEHRDIIESVSGKDLDSIYDDFV